MKFSLTSITGYLPPSDVPIQQEITTHQDINGVSFELKHNIVEFASLEELIAWIRQIGHEVIMNADFPLTDIPQIMIYDDYAE